MQTFDERGHLFPHEMLEMELHQFEAIFVENLDDRFHRRALFYRYLDFVEAVKTQFGTPFFQWLDGSFITMKPLPNDLDVVTFLTWETIIRRPEAVCFLAEKSADLFGVDAHFCPICKWNHRFYEESKRQEASWRGLFGQSRKDERGQKHPKGIVKIQF